MDLHEHVSLNLDIRGLGLSATLAINERIKELQKNGKEIYNFGLGQSPFPVPVPVVDALKLHAHEKDYLPVKGLPALRKAVAEFHKKMDHVEIKPKNVLVGPGSKELMFLLQLVYYGEIILPTPCWVSYGPQAQILNRHIQFIHTSLDTKWQITPQQLEELCANEHDVFRPRILILNYPSNPHGGSYSIEELKKIAKIARKYEIILLSDEIYGQLHFKGEHNSVARYYPEGTIISSGLSKWCGAGGWRLGTFSFPTNLNWLLEAMAAVASETYTSVSAPIQYAAVRAFRGGIRIERYLWQTRRILSTLGDQCTNMFNSVDIRVNPPVGAFYLFLDFTHHADKFAKRGIFDSKTLCERLINETGVALLPGVSFERPASELTARLAYINFDGAKALAAAETIPIDEKLPDDFIEINFEKTLLGVEKIIKWLNIND
jgi:aspartate aminotransferase